MTSHATALGADQCHRERAVLAVFHIFIYNKQGSTASGKWRSLAGLLPGGGLKAGPPLDPPRPSIFPFPSARGRTGAGGLRNLRMSEKRRRTGAVWCWPAAKFLHWKPRRREPHTPDTLRTRLRLNMLRYSVQKPHCPQCEGRDELEHLSQAGGGAMNSSTSHRRAWHQPWACDDCRPLGLARLCFIASRRVPAPSRRLILCASGKTGGWEPRGVPLAHVLPNVALMQ